MKIGLFRKYLLSKADGSELDPQAKYFVIRYDAAAEHGAAGRAALLEYADKIQEDCPELARDLLSELREAPEKDIRVRALFLLMRGA
ncbi:MAG: hypothetical protein KME14_20420 [Tildeniella torsiva UHER 1998/13D]|jgi:hypothetical protein|nr:hypothetical protein [Tildeniella torsiva UHER 1998/13D]